MYKNVKKSEIKVLNSLKKEEGKKCVKCLYCGKINCGINIIKCFKCGVNLES